ncbi:MAG: CopG family transcriptional regulator [Proteobacteria bacterium]|nr:CopG family transcriptional regulator [Pseudomonadota bacterium]
MEQQNVTISVPKPLLKKAKILAASRDQSLSELFRETLDQRVRVADGYNKAKIPFLHDFIGPHVTYG